MEDIEEVVVDIARDDEAYVAGETRSVDGPPGRERIRLALPALTRIWEEKGVGHKVQHLRAAGWVKWEAANLSAWSHLQIDPLQAAISGLDLATDWSVYVLNRMAARQLLSMGVSRFALSPEDGLANYRSLLAEFARVRGADRLPGYAAVHRRIRALTPT